MDPEKENLLAQYRLVHSALRMLKMGETGYVKCSKEYSAEMLREYIMAYAFHKRKWFKVKYDKLTNAIVAVRSPPPPWDVEPEEVEPDEP